MTQATGVFQQHVVIRLIREACGFRIGQRNADLPSSAVDVGNGEVSVFGAAAGIPGLGVSSPSGQVDIGASRILELQLQAVVRPPLHDDIVLAGLDGHYADLAASSLEHWQFISGGDIGIVFPDHFACVACPFSSLHDRNACFNPPADCNMPEIIGSKDMID